MNDRRLLSGALAVAAAIVSGPLSKVASARQIDRTILAATSCRVSVESSSRQDFTDIRDVTPLPGSGYLVVDQGQAELWWLPDDLSQGRQIGGRGRGPEEYLRPERAFRWLGDTTIVTDPGSRSYIFISPGGRIVRKEQFPQPGYWGGLLGASSNGRLLFGIPARLPDLRGEAILVAADIALTKVDTITNIARPETMEVLVSQDGGRATGRFVAPLPFAAGDAGVMGPDGEVRVVRVSPLRLDRYPPSQPDVLGLPITYSPVSVTAADRAQAKTDDQARRLPWSGGTYRYPSQKSAFVHRSALPAPGGTVWLKWQEAHGTSGTLYVRIATNGPRMSCRFPDRTEILRFVDEDVALGIVSSKDGEIRVTRCRIQST